MGGPTGCHYYRFRNLLLLKLNLPKSDKIPGDFQVTFVKDLWIFEPWQFAIIMVIMFIFVLLIIYNWWYPTNAIGLSTYTQWNYEV